jgi:hypothetical protein
MVESPNVSVVIPAYNAAGTLANTLASATDQTYRSLEILVVNDGSTDDTSSIVLRHSHADPRIRLIEKSHGGVASARNLGIAQSAAPFVAFLDADDLWHPTKISKQMAVLNGCDADTSLVYAPYRLIDDDGIVLRSTPFLGIQGWVLFRHFFVNPVGNGSAILVRKHVLDALGGFPTCLRDNGAQGSEDLLLQLRIASRYRFAVVPEYLVGYRRRSGSMSSNPEQMIESATLATKIALAELSGTPALDEQGILMQQDWQRLLIAVKHLHFARAVEIGWKLKHSPAFLLSNAWRTAFSSARKAGHHTVQTLSQPSRRHFYDYTPEEGIDLKPATPTLKRLLELDRAYGQQLAQRRQLVGSSPLPAESSSSRSYFSARL